MWVTAFVTLEDESGHKAEYQVGADVDRSGVQTEPEVSAPDCALKRSRAILECLPYGWEEHAVAVLFDAYEEWLKGPEEHDDIDF